MEYNYFKLATLVRALLISSLGVAVTNLTNESAENATHVISKLGVALIIISAYLVRHY